MVQRSMSSRNGGSGPINSSGKKARKRLSWKQKVEVFELLHRGTEKAEIDLCYACSERTVSSVIEKKREPRAPDELPSFNGKAKTEKIPEFPEVRDQHDANTQCAVFLHSLASFSSFSYRSVHACPRQR